MQYQTLLLYVSKCLILICLSTSQEIGWEDRLR